MLTSGQLDAIRQFDTCTIANAIEHFRVRLRNGVVSIPLEISHEVPAVAERIRVKDQRIVQLCLSKDFSVDKLAEAIRGET
jgi:hypothetical protein